MGPDPLPPGPKKASGHKLPANTALRGVKWVNSSTMVGLLVKWTLYAERVESPPLPAAIAAPFDGLRLRSQPFQLFKIINWSSRSEQISENDLNIDFRNIFE